MTETHRKESAVLDLQEVKAHKDHKVSMDWQEHQVDQVAKVNRAQLVTSVHAVLLATQANALLSAGKTKQTRSTIEELKATRKVHKRAAS